jgi:hypothetical protein
LSNVLLRIVQPDLRQRWATQLGIGADEKKAVEA